MTVALVSLLLAASCSPAVQAGSQTATADERTRPQNAAAVALVEAERVDASFAAIPTAVDAALAAAPGAGVASLREAVGQAYRQEAAELREALLADASAPPLTADVARSLAALAKAHDAAAKDLPWNKERSTAAEPNGQEIIALSAAMAAPRFAEERALTVRRVAWARDRLRRGGTTPSLSVVSDQVAEMIASTRQAEDRKAAAKAGAGGTGEDDGRLVQALSKLPAADIATLTAWYGSPAGKAAKEHLVGSFQGANDRAGRMALIQALTHPGSGG